ncbi:MAG: M28 family peptidase [Candidatus Helarchaeota archaeon]
MSDDFLDYQNYMYNFIKKICDQIGPRIGWSGNEKRAAETIKEELNKYCDETTIEEFEYSRSFYKMFSIPLILNLMGVFFYLIILMDFNNLINIYASIISCICFSLSLFFLFGQFIFNKDVMKIFARSGKSQNVIGKMRVKEPKWVIIFSGHHDSTWHFTLMGKLKEKFLIFMVIVIFFLFASLIMSIINMIYFLLMLEYNAILDLITRIIYVGTIPFLGTFSLFMIDKRRPILGANDNLSGVAVVLGIAKYLAEHGRPKNIETWFISFGSEEGGLHGSKAFVKKHEKELSKDNIILINLDTIGYGTPRIIRKEILKSHDQRVVELIDVAANNLQIQHRIMGSGGGRTDAMSFTEKGYKASSIITLEEGKKMPPHYHTVKDTPEIIDPKSLKNILKISLELIRLIDEEEFKI